MNHHVFSFTLAALLALLGLPSAMAQEANPIEAKLRETLRSTMLQLRKEQGDRVRLEAELQALKTTSEKEAKEMKAKFEELAKRSGEEKAAADKSIADLRKSMEMLDARGATLATSLEKWKAAHAEITRIAHKKESERAAQQDKAQALERVVAERERQNLALFQTGNEILNRYEKFALGRALLAREPFTGISRVKLEEQVQGYKDQLDDQLARSGQTDAPAIPPPPAPIQAAGAEAQASGQPGAPPP